MLLRAVLALPGLTAAHLLHWVDQANALALQMVLDGQEEEAATVRAFAAQLRDAAPGFPTPPRVPANASGDS